MSERLRGELLELSLSDLMAAAAGKRDALVIRRAESTIIRIGNQTAKDPARIHKLAEHHLSRAVGGTVIDDNHFEIYSGLTNQ